MAILIVETGETPGKMPEKCGTIAQWFENALDEIGKKAETVRPYRGEALPVATSVAGAIITGSWSMVTDREDWSEKTAEWIRELLFFDIPVFGVCYGHQLMAHALGGLVGDNPEGGEKGAFTVSLTGKAAKNPLFDGFPDPVSGLSLPSTKRSRTAEKLRHSGYIGKGRLPDPPLRSQRLFGAVSSGIHRRHPESGVSGKPGRKRV